MFIDNVSMEIKLNCFVFCCRCALGRCDATAHAQAACASRVMRLTGVSFGQLRLPGAALLLLLLLPIGQYPSDNITLHPHSILSLYYVPHIFQNTSNSLLFDIDNQEIREFIILS